MPAEAIVQDAWSEHVAWSKAATRLKNRRTGARVIVLALTIAGAALQTLAGTLLEGDVRTYTGGAGAVALVLVPLLVGYFLKPEETKKWLRARSISEGIKSKVYTFRALGSMTPVDELKKDVRDIRGWGKDLERIRSGIDPGNDTPPGELDSDAYLRLRVLQQIDNYYLPKAKWHASRAELFRWLEIALGIAAAVLGVIATYVADPASAGPWVAVLTTIGGSIAAYAASSRYDFQATTFFATAQQLKDLTHDWSDGTLEWPELVRSCEEVISAENRAWMAKLEETQEPPADAPGS